MVFAVPLFIQAKIHYFFAFLLNVVAHPLVRHPFVIMNNLQKIITALGLEPNIALAVLVMLSAFMVVINILYICVPFFLLSIRKEIIELNKHLRTLYILNAQTKIKGKNEVVVSNEDKSIYDEKPSTDTAKFKLDDEDIKKLKTIGLDME